MARSSGDIGDVEKATRDVLGAVFSNLKDSATVKAEGQTRLFFPNGIELISVTLKVNAKDGIDVEVKVAGEKGIKTVAAARSADGHGLTSSALPFITFIDPPEVAAGWEGDVKIVGGNFDAGSFALFDGAVPKTVSVTDTVLTVRMTSGVTGTPGTKTVVVHTGAGDLSNEKPFVVK